MDSDRGTLAAGLETGRQPPWVGREREWEEVRAHAARAAAGQGGMLLWVGEAGIGKTTLLRHLGQWAAAGGFRVLSGRHPAHPLAPPLHGLRQAFAPLFGLDLSQPPARVDQAVHAAVARDFPALELHRQLLVEFLEPLAAQLDRGLGEQAREHRSLLYYVLGRALQTAAQSRPVVLLLDDLHWADALSLEALRYLAPLLAGQAVLVCAACREAAATEPAAALRALAVAEGVTRHALGRLGLDEVTRLASLHGLADDPTFCHCLWTHSEGVPLYVEQWLLACRSATRPLAEVLAAPPTTVAQVVRQRLAGVPAAVLPVLHAAAVIGDGCTAQLLAEVCGQSAVAVLSALTALEATHGLMRPAEGGGYAFQHGLLRQAAYDALPASRREALHLQVGAALGAGSTADPQRAFAVAYHYAAGQRPDLATDTLLAAARQARALQALTNARALLLQGLACATGSDHQAELAEALGHVALELDDRTEARARWEQALTWQQRPARRSDLYRHLAKCCHGDMQQQRWYHHQALAAAPADSIERALALIALAWNPGTEAGDEVEPGAHVARYFAAALRILRHHPSHPCFVEALVGRLPFIRDRRSAHLPRVRRLLRRGLRLATAQDAWRVVIRAHMALATSYRGTDLAAAAQHGQAALRLAAAYYPPDDPILPALRRRLYQTAVAAGDTAAAAHWASQLPPVDGADPWLARLRWRDDPDQAWQALTGHLTELQIPGHEHELSRCISALQRLATQAGWDTRGRAFLAQFAASRTAALTAAGLALWELRPAPAPAPAPAAALAPASHLLGLADLAWCPQGPSSQVRRLSADEVEIVPGPEVGLGWLNHAPALLTPVLGDFSLSVRVSPASHGRHAGGLLVRQGNHALLRFASGIDHVGQISLGHRDGTMFRCLTTVNLPHTELHLHLVRTGVEYQARFSPDGSQWYQGGQITFGRPGEVAVGVFAECNYEYDFPQPFPIRLDHLRLHAERALAAPRPRALAPPPLHPLPAPPQAWHDMVGAGPVFRAFCAQLEQVSRSPQPVLLWGETGTGKDLAARAVHALSGRTGSFVAVNVAALPQALFEAELFGHRKGAFTGAHEGRPGLFRAAAGGTLFLDEIGELPLPVQAALLRALESGEVRAVGDTQAVVVDSRCVAATVRNLAHDVAAGRFRQDLYYRLGQPVEAPPLRHRRDDLALLVAHLLALPSTAPVPGLTRAAMERLYAHDWPGNVRELRNTMERAAARAAGQAIDEAHLQLEPVPAPAPPAPSTPTPAELQRCLHDHGQNVSAVARFYGVNRRTVYRWLQRSGMKTLHLRA